MTISIPDHCPRCNLKPKTNSIGITSRCPNDLLCPIGFAVDVPSFDANKGSIRLLFRVGGEKYYIYLRVNDSVTYLSLRDGSWYLIESIVCPDDFSYDQEYLESFIRMMEVFG